MPTSKKPTRSKARDENRMAVEGGNRAAKRRAEEAAMDKKDKMPAKKAYGGKMGKKPMKKMAKGGMTRGCGAATKGKRYSRSA